MQKLVELGKLGIAITGETYESKTQFLFTKLTEIKPGMIEEATKNAREAAEKFALEMKNPAVPKAFGTWYLIVMSYYFHIRSLTPQQAARNALAIRFKKQARQNKEGVTGAILYREPGQQYPAY